MHLEITLMKVTETVCSTLNKAGFLEVTLSSDFKFKCIKKLDLLERLIFHFFVALAPD